MNSTRRKFLQSTIAAGAVLATSAQARAQAAQSGDAAAKRGPGKKFLILGGTGFLGPAIVEAATARGHTITLFNRGKTRPGLFPDVEKLRGDRDPDKDEGLKALEGRKWDVVFDDCGYYPRMVEASAKLLAPNVKNYIYISSVSAYGSFEKEGADETSPVGTMPDPTLEKMGDNYEFYGPLKALCEQAAEAAAPGRVANVRPGYIVGPGDPTDRFTYWPVRFARGGTVLVPGAPTDPIQVIDVRDLAEWLVKVAEDGTTGVFNAVGPTNLLTWGETIEACKKAAGKPAETRWVPLATLAQHMSVEEMPIWAPYDGAYKGFHNASNARATKAGLKSRPIATIVKDTLTWWESQPEERRAKLRAGLPAEREAEILAKIGKA
jgi:2'-hydroxyisoflavone reductase